MEMLEIFLWNGLVVWGIATGVWIASVIKQKSCIIDPFWSLLFLASALWYVIASPGGNELRQWLLLAIVTIWSLRLSIYLFWRNWGKPEDRRYAKWRNEAGKTWWWRSFITVFTLQAAMAWVISVPLLGAAYAGAGRPLGWFDALAVMIWAIGFFFESVGDWQLAAFKANPDNKGKVLDHGVWRYTRHPNYFGDATQWWGFFMLSVAAGVYWTVIGPLFMTALIIKVSGVALLEKDLADSKPKYRDYIERTPAFFPWFPKSKDS